MDRASRHLGAAIALLAVATVAATGPELKTYSALTKPITLRPGEVSNSFHKLPVPAGPIAVYSFVAEVVKEDENGEVVPALLSEVYLHHHVVGSNFGGKGATSCRSPLSFVSPSDFSRILAATVIGLVIRGGEASTRQRFQ